jgi:protein-S-isoprenylcysteine O-methyltransferase Ste14
VPRGASRLEKVPAAFVVALALLLAPASLILFGFFLWRGSLQYLDLRLGTGAALAWDGLLSAAFFVQHSGMVRRSFRRRLAGVVPAAYHGALYALASGAVLLALLVLWQRAPLLVSLEGAPQAAVRSLFLLAMAAFLWAVQSLGSFDPFGLRPALGRLRESEPPTAPLVIGGPYRWVRHPIYSSLIVAIWACPLVTMDRLVFNVLWTAWMVAGAWLEDRDLAAEFGESYRRYQDRVPMLLPRRRPLSSGSGSP